MGNSESEVDNSLKAQAGGAGSPELYKWIAVGGGGIIFDAMKEAMLTKDFSEVDSLIQNEIPKYLYNDGEGDMVIEILLFFLFFNYLLINSFSCL